MWQCPKEYTSCVTGGTATLWEVLRSCAHRLIERLNRDRQLSLALGLLGVAVLGAAVLVPDTRIGGIAALVIVAGGGVLIALALSSVQWQGISSRWGTLLAYGIVLVVGYAVFQHPWRDAGGLFARDWGTHHAVTKALAVGLRSGHVPVWSNHLSTGEAPFELYPSLTYYLAAGYAALFDRVQSIPLVLTRLAIIVQVLLAIGTVRLGLRFVSWPLATIAGILVLVDRGNGTSGGVDSVLYWGLLHNGVALCFWVFALGFLADALMRPRLGASVGFWILGTLGIVAHPIGLVFAVATLAALLAVAAFARDIPPRRALVGAFHIVLVVALSAAWWQPLASRLLHYGVHYGAAPMTTSAMFAEFAQHALPYASLVVAVYLGYLGIVAAGFSRRAVPTLVAAIAAILLVGVSSELYLLLDLGPSPALARFSAMRMLSWSKILVYLCAVYVLGLVVAQVRARWHGRIRMVGAAVVALAVAWFARGAMPFLVQQTLEIEDAANNRIPGAGDMRALVAWGREQVAEMSPDRFGRLMYDDVSNAVFHLEAESGLPTVSLGAISDLMLRERIENRSGASLRRFCVRWVMRYGKSPKLGNPKTELEIGRFHIREVSGWDGHLARVERGDGEAVVTAIEDERIDVELRGTDRPALVALGVGYYPRWRAYHESGRSVPVYAFPATRRGKTRVLAAWLPPGHTEFRPDGSLPSDGEGTGPTALAFLAMVAILVVWSWPRQRRRLLRLAARGRRRAASWWRRRRRAVAVAAAGVSAVAIALAAWSGARAPTAALQVGNGLIGSVQVEARRPNGRWRNCPYDRLAGMYVCYKMLEVKDRFGDLLNDAAPSWPFVTPIIEAKSRKGSAEFRIHLSAVLAGEYWTMTRNGRVSLTVGANPPVEVARQTKITYSAAGDREIVLQGIAGKKPLLFAFVLASSVSGDQDYPMPPASAPSELLRSSE